MGITHLCENAHFTYKILQYTCFNCTCYTCSRDKFVWDMSQYNKLSDIQYARFQILPVDLHFGVFWSTGIPTMPWPALFDQTMAWDRHQPKNCWPLLLSYICLVCLYLVLLLLTSLNREIIICLFSLWRCFMCILHLPIQNVKTNQKEINHYEILWHSSDWSSYSYYVRCIEYGQQNSGSGD